VAQPKSGFSLSWLPRPRWNVVDLVTVFGREAIPSYLFCDLDLSFAENMKARMAKQGIHITVTAILIKAISVAQTKHPLSHTIALPFGKKFTIPHIIAGFTVERMVDDKPAVFIGTIENPLDKSVAEIASELSKYHTSQIADIPQLALEERFSHMPWLIRQTILWFAKYNSSLRLKYLGATFGLSSLGKYGVKAATGPCVCTTTFGVGRIEERPVVENEKVAIKPMLTLTLAFDNRVMDDFSATSFLGDVRKLVEGGIESDVDPCQV
jgi:pyruvate/2-oxoglutarate dehydrogenase complex dihydrolipoamide acyltransferase (E2) component